MIKASPRIETAIAQFRQILSFGGVGAVGFVVDAAIFTLVNLFWTSLYGARVISYLAAATTTWALNRRFTFGASDAPPWREWVRFVVSQSGGGLVNYGVYAFLVSMIEFFTRTPVAAIAVGSLAGMGVNFMVAKFYVFRSRS